MTPIATAEEAVAGFVAGFDPSSRMRTADAAASLRRIGRMESMLAGAKALAAARAAESPSWRKDGAKSAAERLARTTGISVGQAISTIQTGQRLAELPDVLSATKAGLLSPAQLVPVAEAAQADPKQARHLVDLASTTPLGNLKDACRRVKLAADGEDPEARRRKIHDARYLRTWTDNDGAGRLDAKDNPEVIARVKAGLVEERERIFQANRKNGIYHSPEALDWDALVAKVTREPAVGAAPVKRTRRKAVTEKVFIRVDLPTLFRGRPIDGETCEVAGYGPIAVSAVTEAIESGSAFIAAVLTNATQLLGVVHLGRGPNAQQQTAMEWLSPTCDNEACQSPYDLEYDHDHGHEWKDTHTTLIDYLSALCGHDHDLKTNHGWALVDGTGKRAFVPPDDPRHPKNQRAEKPPPAPG